MLNNYSAKTASKIFILIKKNVLALKFFKNDGFTD